MSVLALLAALLLEYFRPLPGYFLSYPWFSRYAYFVERMLNAGEHHHGILAWMLLVLPPVALAALAYLFLGQLFSLLGALWAAAVLYFLMGFRHALQNAGSLAIFLRNQKEEDARRLLDDWLGVDASGLSSAEMARLGIEATLSDTYRYLFGVIFWFALLGPGGAVLYRLSWMVDGKWSGLDEDEFSRFASRVFAVLDWLPQRLTAISFAIVGDFDDAIYCWRSQAQQWTERGAGIVLASGAGAMGVKLGDAREDSGRRPELGLGDEADADYLDSAVGMVWRALVLWLALLLLLGFA